jgi:predicted CoA-binding protein/GNAT superfamily N-acetyltransferase
MADRAVLRDGSVVQLRLASPGDHAMLGRFFHRLSLESLHRRFFGLAEPSDALLDTFCTSSDPAQAATLLALREVEGELRPIAAGSYFRADATSAEVAFAVDDRFQGRGLGTVLLERLAALASSHGVTRFEALTLSDNAPMLNVFRESGFEIHSKPDHECVNVRLSLDPTSRAVAAAEQRDACATVTSLRPLFEPASVAVVGASRDIASIGRRVLRALASGGFKGPIYAINPNAKELDGAICYASLTEIPRGVDLAVIAVPRARVLEVVDQCAAVGIKSIVVITAGFAEGGDQGRALNSSWCRKCAATGSAWSARTAWGC